MRRTIAVSIALLPVVLLLGWAPVSVALAGGGCHGANTVEAWPTEAVSTVVKIDGCTFAPTVTRVQTGTEVRFLNASNAAHDIVGRARAWGTDRLDSGASFAYRFTTPGVYPYSCSLHPGMAGVVVAESSVAAAPVAKAPDAAPVSVTTPVAPTADNTSVPYIAAGGLGLLGGLAIGAAVVARRRRPI